MKTPREDIDTLVNDDELGLMETLTRGLDIVDRVIPEERSLDRQALASAREIINGYVADPNNDRANPPREVIGAFSDLSSRCADVYVGAQIARLGNWAEESVFGIAEGGEFEEFEGFEDENDPFVQADRLSEGRFRASSHGGSFESTKRPEGAHHIIHANDEVGAPFYVWEHGEGEDRVWYVEERLSQYVLAREDANHDKPSAREYTRYDDIGSLREHLTRDSDIPLAAEEAVESGTFAGTETYAFSPADLERMAPVWRGEDPHEYNIDFREFIIEETLNEATHHESVYLGSQWLSSKQRVCDGIDGRTDCRINDRIVLHRAENFDDFKASDVARQMRAMLSQEQVIDDASLVRITDLAGSTIDAAGRNRLEFRDVSQALHQMTRSGRPFPAKVADRLREIAPKHPAPAIAQLMTQACEQWSGAMQVTQDLTVARADQDHESR